MQSQHLREMIRPVQLPPIRNSEPIAQHADDDLKEFELFGSKYQPEFLNERQREIFDYVLANPNQIVFVQGRTGTGKTFLLRTIGHSRRARNVPTEVILYKHDHLHKFKYIANRKTVAQIFMDIFRLGYEDYNSLWKGMCRQDNAAKFITELVSLLKRAKMPAFGKSLVMLDEYTCIPEPLLFLLLILLKRYKIGAIVCGDRNLMPMNPSSPLIKSFDIVSNLADESYNLEENIRCTDARYNCLIDYIRQFSTENFLDDFAFAIVAAMFPKQLLSTSTTFSAIHLGCENKVVTHQVDTLVREQNIPVSFYCVNTQNVEPDCVINYKSFGPNRLGEFSPYLPLHVGTYYYVYKHSEAWQATLVNVDLENEVMTLRSKDGIDYQVKKSNDDHSMFAKHKRYILGGRYGNVHNYPIYPANIMSFHKSQAFNIDLPIDLSLQRADWGVSYQALYVALSKVKSPDQIVRISMPSIISHLVSTIINFPEHADKSQITAESLATRMAENYVHYNIEDESLLPHCAKFFDDATPTDLRQTIRKNIHEKIKCNEHRNLRPPMNTNQSTTVASQELVKHWPEYEYLAFSQIEEE